MPLCIFILLLKFHNSRVHITNTQYSFRFIYRQNTATLGSTPFKKRRYYQATHGVSNSSKEFLCFIIVF
jgi:hypothetical protein